MVRRLLWGVVMLGLVAGLLGAARRARVELRNRAVEIAVDWDEVVAVAAGQRVPLGEALQRLKTAGVDSVMVAEDTLGDWVDRGDLLVGADSLQTRLVLATDSARSRFEKASPIRTELASSQQLPGRMVRIQQPWELLSEVGMGLPPDVVSTVRSSGLQVVGRVGAGLGVDTVALRLQLGALAAAGVRIAVFTGDRLPGSPSHLPRLAEILRDPAVDLLYGSVEFGKQRGDSQITKIAADRVVRVHAVTAAEMPSATPEENIQRYSLAARERNIRLCFVRLFVDAADPLDSACRYLSSLRKALSRANMGRGAARPFESLAAPVWVRALCGLASGAGVLLLLDMFTGWPSRRPAWLALAVLPAALAALPFAMGAKLVALVAGCAFPSLGLVAIDLSAPGRAGMRDVLRRVLVPTAVTLVGTTLVVGLLSDRVFLVKGDSFAGVKLTLVVPVATAAAAYLLGLRRGDTGDFRERCAVLARGVRELWDRPVLLGQVLLAAGALVGLAVMVMRSGNDPGVGVSGIELKLRSVLDRLLLVRPRFKDLIGHPAMVLGVAAMASGRRGPAGALLCLGAVGQASLLNTFCHLHTPLWASAARDLIGLAIGGIAGLLVAAWWQRRPIHAA